VEETLTHFAVGLGIGLLFGVERGWKTREEADGARTAGIRTFALAGLLGSGSGSIALVFGEANALAAAMFLAAAFAVHAFVLTMFSRDENRAEGTFSATTVISGMLAFLLAAFAAVGDMRVSAAVAVAAVGILALRKNLHGLLRRITWPELRSALILLAMTFIILPIVPDRSYDLVGGVNPRQIWMIAIILAGVSFFGYVAVRSLGERHGVLLAAAAGGLASSTAVTLANARSAARGEGAPRVLAAGVALAMAISFIRVLVISGALAPTLLASLAAPLVAAALCATGLALLAVYGWDNPRPAAATSFSNPFNLVSVLSFAALLAVVIAIGNLLGSNFGAGGALLGAAALGLADVDAVAVSMAKMTPQTLDAPAAALAILIAVISNTATKLAIGGVIGRGRFALDIAIVSGFCLAAGGLAWWAAAAVFGAH